MKKKLLYLIIGIFVWSGFTACSESEGTYPLPTPLVQESIKAISDNGKITLTWDVPADANYYYVKIQYTLPESGKMCTKLASVYNDSVTIDGLLARFGEIEFTLQPFNKDGKGGEIYKVTGKADNAPKTVVLNGKKELVPLSLSQLGVNSLEEGDGSLSAMIDGDKKTFYHGNYSNPRPLPHYIVIDLKRDVYAFSFFYAARDNANRSNPKEIEVWGSNTFPGTLGGQSDTGFDTTVADAVLLTKLTGLPDTQAAEYTSAPIKGTQSFRYVWLKVTAITNGKAFIALSELTVTDHKTSTYDPETGLTTDN